MNEFPQILNDLFRLDFPAHVHGLALLGSLAAIGLVIGMLASMFGVGGGFLIVPLLNVVLGIDAAMAVGSSLSFTIGTAGAGAARHWRLGNVEFRAALLLACGALGGVWGGKSIHSLLEWSFGAGFKTAFRVIYLIALLLIAWVVYRGPKEHDSGKSLLQRIKLGPTIDLVKAGREGVSVIGLMVLGVAMGLIAGLLGIGGGVLVVPLLLFVAGVGIRVAVGMSLVAMVFGSTLGTTLYGLDGSVNLSIVMGLLVGSSVGVQIGAALAHRLHTSRLRQYFVYVVLAAAVVVAVGLVLGK